MFSLPPYFIETTDSTNKFLSEMLECKDDKTFKMDDGFAVYAHSQTAGRGMGSNRWFSNAGENILASIYFEPGIDASKQFDFNRCFALAVRQTIAKYIPDAMIKWPNDILIKGDKIAGILIEHSIRGNKLAYSIAGVGININQTTFDSSIPHPTSLKLHTHKNFNINEILDELISCCKLYYTLLKQNELATLQKEYLQHLYRLHTPALYFYNNQHITATIIGIDEFGRLQLNTENGQWITCGFKEIVFE